MKTGDIVSIKEDSSYAYQIQNAGNNRGEITEINGIWYHLRFENDYTNHYHLEDLKLIKPKEIEYEIY